MVGYPALDVGIVTQRFEQAATVQFGLLWCSRDDAPDASCPL
jgi:hypothetical protein